MVLRVTRYPFEPSDLTLYVARSNGAWLDSKSDESEHLKQGHIPEETALRDDSIKMGLAGEFLERPEFQDTLADEDQIHLLVDLPFPLTPRPSSVVKLVDVISRMEEPLEETVQQVSVLAFKAGRLRVAISRIIEWHRDEILKVRGWTIEKVDPGTQEQFEHDGHGRKARYSWLVRNESSDCVEQQKDEGRRREARCHQRQRYQVTW